MTKTIEVNGIVTTEHALKVRPITIWYSSDEYGESISLNDEQGKIMIQVPLEQLRAALCEQ